MPRARNIKPGFFKNDELAEIEPLGRILFSGLWCLADREGRLEERVKRIKAEVLPYDDCDIETLLAQLARPLKNGAEPGFIIRYEVDNVRYIQITHFRKHQNPHVKESASEIPAPDSIDQHHTSTVQTPDNNQKSTELARLIPDSLNLIPDSVLPESGARTGDGNSNDLKNIYKAFSDNIHPITPMEADGLAAWLDEDVEPALITWAIREAVNNGARTAKYINTIIRNLVDCGIKTLAGVEARECDRKKAREPTKPVEASGAKKQYRPSPDPPPDPEFINKIKSITAMVGKNIDEGDRNEQEA